MSLPVIIDRPPPGWFALRVMRTESRKWSWVALMIDAPPDPDQRRKTWDRAAWVKIPGKHRNWDAAWKAFEDMMTTRH